MISTIVINLRRRPDRKKFAIAECKNIDIDPIILDATDAKYLAEEWIERSATSEMREKIADPNFHWVNIGALACSDSHRRSWDELLKNEIWPSLVLEDDFFWLKNKTLTLKIINDISVSDFDLILLGYSLRKRVPVEKLIGRKIHKNFLLLEYDVVGHTAGSYAYFLTKKGAERLKSSQAAGINREADDFAMFLDKKSSLRMGLIFPPLVHSGLFDSTIWEKSDKFLLFNFRKIFGFLSVRSNGFRRIYAWALSLRLERKYVDSPKIAE